MRRFVLLAILLSGVLAQAEVPKSALPLVLELRCEQLKLARSLCRDLRQNLGAASDVAAKRVERMQRWAQLPVVQQSARKLAERARRKVDRGFALAVLGRSGEGLRDLLAAWQADARLQIAADGTFMALLLAWPQLDAVQRRDWSANLAGRLAVHVDKQNEAIFMLRLAYMYNLAGEQRAIEYYLARAQVLAPQDARVQQAIAMWQEERARTNAPKKKKNKLRRKHR